MKFREHRGGLSESLATMVTLADRPALVEHCRGLNLVGCPTFDYSDLRIETHSGADSRIGWKETFIVSIDGFGFIGFTDSAN